MYLVPDLASPLQYRASEPSCLRFVLLTKILMLTYPKGRSPYEPPDTATIDPSSPVRRVSSYHADNYMQQYDARGHPVNPQSRVLGRELRRAKNDILSTMGVVVSGEDRNARSSNEQQKIEEVATENDFGLIITTLDQLSVLFGTWWTASLAERIQVY